MLGNFTSQDFVVFLRCFCVDSSSPQSAQYFVNLLRQIASSLILRNNSAKLFGKV